MTSERLYTRVMERHTYLAKNQGFEGSNPFSCTTLKRKEIKMKIYKFPIDYKGEIPICKPLAVNLQKGVPVFWALVPETDEEKELAIQNWGIDEIETGCTVPSNGIYLNTLLKDEYPGKVYHYFFHNLDEEFEDFEEPLDEAYEGDNANYELSW